MSVYRNIPIARKFTLAFGLVCLLCVILGTYSYFTFRAIETINHSVSDIAFPSVVHLSKIQYAVNLIRRSDMALLLCQTPDCIARESTQRQHAIEQFKSEMKAYESSISFDRERELQQKTAGAFERYLEASNRA